MTAAELDALVADLMANPPGNGRCVVGMMDTGELVVALRDDGAGRSIGWVMASMDAHVLAALITTALQRQPTSMVWH